MHHRTFITCGVHILFYLYILYIAVYKTYVCVMDSLRHISYIFFFFYYNPITSIYYINRRSVVSLIKTVSPTGMSEIKR